MNTPRPPWYIESSETDYHYAFFISHVLEDTDQVAELRNQITSQSGRGGRRTPDCFLDIDRWLKGNTNSHVIRESLLRSEYFVVWVTPAFLRNRRGWIWMEFAYAELLDPSLNLDKFGTQLPYILPIFHGVSSRPAERTPLQPYIQRNLTRPGARDAPIANIARDLVDFYDQQELRRGGWDDRQPKR